MAAGQCLPGSFSVACLDFLMCLCQNINKYRRYQMRGIDTEVRKSRRRIFKEVAKLAYDSENLIDDMEALPYKIIDNIDPDSADDVYRNRAIVRERVRLAMGMSLRPENAPVHISEGEFVLFHLIMRNIKIKRVLSLQSYFKMQRYYFFATTY